MSDKEKQPIFMRARQTGKPSLVLAEEFIYYVENVVGVPLFEYQKNLIRLWVWREMHSL